MEKRDEKNVPPRAHHVKMIRGCFVHIEMFSLSILSAQPNPARIWLKNVSSLHDS